jgi:hypothetical protein
VPTSQEAALILDDVPELLTIAEVARLLRISRTTAYAEAKRFERTGDGLPVIRIGRSLRTPREMLRRLIAGDRSWSSESLALSSEGANTSRRAEPTLPPGATSSTS